MDLWILIFLIVMMLLAGSDFILDELEDTDEYDEL